jgi:hypothetical protein
MLFRIMKHLCLLCLLMTFALQGKSQHIISFEELPDPVKRYFPVVYKLEDTVPVQWTIEDTLYVARFMSDNYPVEVRMKANGFWVITLWDIDSSFLPSAITDFCRRSYSEYSILRSRLTNNPFNEQRYILTLQPSEPNSETINLYFSTNGQPIDQ